jgi:hypothetical protein
MDTVLIFDTLHLANECFWTLIKANNVDLSKSAHEVNWVMNPLPDGRWTLEFNILN